jgi:hypothetical protein
MAVDGIFGLKRPARQDRDATAPPRLVAKPSPASWPLTVFPPGRLLAG